MSARSWAERVVATVSATARAEILFFMAPRILSARSSFSPAQTGGEGVAERRMRGSSGGGKRSLLAKFAGHTLYGAAKSRRVDGRVMEQLRLDRRIKLEESARLDESTLVHGPDV